MLIKPAYPNAASDPRLSSVADKYATLRRQIDDADWQGKPVTNAQRNELTNLRQMVHDGKLYTPNF